ncbi:MAG: alginate lyase family protein [Calditrichia bacterium]
MDVLKYASKLSKMSSHEISFRIKQKARNTVETLRWKRQGRQDMFVPSHISQWDTASHVFPAADLKFFGFEKGAKALQAGYEGHFSKRKEETIKAADKLMKQQFRLLGLDVTLQDTIQWNQNPQTGTNYPMQHHVMMDTFNTEKYGDVKFVWELNRHQFFIELAKSYFVSGNEKYAEKLWSWLESWFEQNPHKIGINHTSVLEHSVRIYAWIWSYYFTAESPIWTKERKATLARNLLLQGEMIEENLSFYYSPYNHLIGELAALSFLGTVYSNSERMIAWRDDYWLEMERQLDMQYSKDGFTVEQATYYHHFTTGFYLQLALLRRQNGLPVSDRAWKHIEQALDFPMRFTRPDGQLPMLGDIDSARSIYFYQPQPMWDLRPFQALGAVVFKRNDMRFVAAEPAEELLWLLGTDGLEEFNTLTPEAPEAVSEALPESGYYMMRDGWDGKSNYCCFDCGDIAHGVFKDETPSAAHGHGDILSFELTVNGSPLIIDPGFYTYFGPLEWHRYFRSTRGHNSIEINGAGQAVHEGRIGWSHVSSPTLLHWASGKTMDFAAGEIDRFAKLNQPVRQQRYMIFRKDAYLLVVDRLVGSATGKLEIESSFHFPPGELRESDGRLFYNDALCAAVQSAAKTNVQISCGGENPDEGWMAEGYGCKTAAPVLRITATEAAPTYLAMAFPLQAVKPEAFSIESREEDGMQILDIAINGLKERIYLNSARKRVSIGDDFETDALCVVASSNPQEKEMQLIKLRHLKRGGEVLDLKIPDQSSGDLNIHLNYSGKPEVAVWK